MAKMSRAEKIPGFALMPHRDNDVDRIIIVIQRGISALVNSNTRLPVKEILPGDYMMLRKHRLLVCQSIFGGRKPGELLTMQDPGVPIKSGMAVVLHHDRIQLGQPGIRFRLGHMLPRFLIRFPSAPCVLAQNGPSFLSLYLLSHRCLHNPMWRPVTCCLQTLYAIANVRIEFDRNSTERVSSHRQSVPLYDMTQ